MAAHYEDCYGRGRHFKIRVDREGVLVQVECSILTTRSGYFRRILTLLDESSSHTKVMRLGEKEKYICVDLTHVNLKDFKRYLRTIARGKVNTYKEFTHDEVSRVVARMYVLAEMLEDVGARNMYLHGLWEITRFDAFSAYSFGKSGNKGPSAKVIRTIFDGPQSTHSSAWKLITDRCLATMTLEDLSLLREELPDEAYSHLEEQLSRSDEKVCVLRDVCEYFEFDKCCNPGYDQAFSKYDFFKCRSKGERKHLADLWTDEHGWAFVPFFQ